MPRFAPAFDRTRFPDRVVISWRYTSANGQPSDAEFKSMTALEDLLESALEQPALAQLVMVSTGDDLREWVYYTRSQDEFMAAMNRALAGQPRFPVEIGLWKDPRWEAYDEFRRKLGTPAARSLPGP